MNTGSQSLLIGGVAAIGVLHTLVPDHWLPVTVMARQRGWSKRETARVALTAGTGHVLSTLFIAVIFWVVGAAVAARFGNAIDKVSSIALIAFGLWIAVAAWRERHHHTHSEFEGVSSNTSRTALMLILGSSPMVEGIPAFFAAGKYGASLVVILAAVFAATTITTYVLLCVFSISGLRRIRFGAIERYGEVLSGIAIAVVGLAPWVWTHH